MNRTEARKNISIFFTQSSLIQEDVRKIKRLAMRHNIRLGPYKKRFCKKCCSDLKAGKISVTKTNKNVVCRNCGYKNRIALA